MIPLLPQSPFSINLSFSKNHGYGFSKNHSPGNNLDSWYLDSIMLSDVEEFLCGDFTSKECHKYSPVSKSNRFKLYLASSLMALK